jgi:hypothetical protein
MIWGSCQCWSGKKCFDGYVPVLGGSHFFVRIVGSGFWGRFWEPPQFFFLLKKIPILRTPQFSEFWKKIQLGGFQGQRFSQNFEPLIFKGSSHKLVLLNQGLFFFLFFFWFLKYFIYLFLGFFFVSFLIIIINDERSKLINDGK